MASCTPSIDQATGETDTPPPRTREWSFRALGGISMGASGVNVGLTAPEKFDLLGGMGGYMDLEYLVLAGARLQLGGFCPLNELAGRDDLDDWAADPPAFCGPVQPHEQWEFEQDFNHLHYDDNGLSMSRTSYQDVFQRFTHAFGNITSQPTSNSPYLPSGLDFEEWRAIPWDQRCDGRESIRKEHRYNAEYNPDGAYGVIPFCDSNRHVTEGLLPSEYDPAALHDSEWEVMLAVDINGNGVRDYGEPVFINIQERFDDFGQDGCTDEFEDGNGGCGEMASAGPDPNDDDYHWWANPLGTEGNLQFDEGEAWRDHGLDGVADTNDVGEGNGEHDVVDALRGARCHSATRRILALTDEDLDGLDFYFDAGIRDVLHSAVATRHVVGALKARGRDIRHYQGMQEQPNALYPDITPVNVVASAAATDWSPDAVGRDLYVEYGDPNATQEQIDAGDGKHVGTNQDAVNRFMLFLTWAANRFPDPDLDVIRTGIPIGAFDSFYSEAMGTRRSYAVTIPPGYDEPDRAELRYPTIYLTHGLGQRAEEMPFTALITSAQMANGDVPKALMVFPDGGCCWIHDDTGERYCACEEIDGAKRCVDPQCTGPSDSCDAIEIPRSLLTEECLGGSLYGDLITDRWGNPRDDMNYATSVLELVDHIDATFRTRVPEVLAYP